MGANLSILTILSVLIYAVFKFNSLVNRNDYKVQVYSQENFFEAKDEFTYETGFTLAAGITSYDGNPDDITDPSIGEVKFYMKSFGSGLFTDPFVELETRRCEKDELTG